MNAPAAFPPAVTRPPLRWLGGKFRDAPKIIEQFPPHDQYVEPYGGGGSVLLRKSRVDNETYNDLDGELVNLFQVLRSSSADQLLRAIELTPYARLEYEAAFEPIEDPVERARRALVRSHMAHGTGGARMDRPTGFRTDGTSGTTNVAGEWASFPIALAAVRERMRGVTIESRPAIELIRRFDDPKVMIYLDPPYPPETRSTKSRKPGERYHTYVYEMTVDDHVELLDLIRTSRAMIALSSYPNALYDEQLSGWQRLEWGARAHRNSPRTEVLHLNPVAVERLGLGRLL
ncbi:DNA adenine methylase [Sphingomonas sp. SRS2]|uniref:DNA adenine methylase n=1 Tax=Sphingomonas sp. SRS2 TaxID=133190 RepID=UPI0006184218|nr:DNA adenine methylase [Sphingomonas sp. SRS2]KKC24917.1 DNA methyltransferase [Sphingomonas sp. SRS2]